MGKAIHLKDSWAVAGGPVVHISDGTATYSGGTVVSPITTTVFTTPSGTTFLLLSVIFGNNPSNGTAGGIVWDNTGTTQVMTLIQRSTGTSSTVELWGLVAPAIGNKTLMVTWGGGNSNYTIEASYWSGVDQVTPTAHTSSVTSGTSTTPTATIATTSGNAVAALFIDDGNTNGAIAPLSDTTIYTSTSGRVNGSNYKLSTATSATLTATFGSSSAWLSVGVDIKAG